MAKDVGAKKVIMASCAPPIRYPNVYGIDMPSRLELVAHGRTTEQVAEAIGADLVIFQTLPDLVASVRQLNPTIEQFECSVFSGEYVTGGVDATYLDHLESLRSDNMKTKGVEAVPVLAASGAAAVNGRHAGTDVDIGKGGERVSGRTTPSGGDSVNSSSPASPTPGNPVNGVDATIGLHNTWKLS
jgi:amidophosphoribosyltransferase